jgi:hypothetical protein
MTNAAPAPSPVSAAPGWRMSYRPAWEVEFAWSLVARGGSRQHLAGPWWAILWIEGAKRDPNPGFLGRAERSKWWRDRIALVLEWGRMSGQGLS